MRQRLGDLLQLEIVEASRHVRRAGKEDALQRIELPVADGGESTLQRCRVDTAEADDSRGVFGHAGVAQLFEQLELERLARVEPPPQPWLSTAAQVVDRAPQVRRALVLGAPAGKRLRFESRGAPDVAARAVHRVQGTDDHVEATRRKTGIHEAPAEPVDQLLERYAPQPLLDEPIGESRKIEGRRRTRRSGRRCFDDVGRRLRSISASGGTHGRTHDRPRGALAQCLRACRTTNGCRGRSGSGRSLPPPRRAT